MADKKSDSPSVTKKKNITVRRSKSETKPKSKSTDALTVRNIFSNFSNNRKKNVKETIKIENEAGPSTEIDSEIFQQSTNEIESSPQGGITFTEKDAEEYYMEHKKRGKAIILNHENFDKEETRLGTQIDVDKLQEVLEKLKFQVEIHKDLEYGGILDLLKKLSADDYTDDDCIMFYILTHGNKRREISSKDVYYPVEKLWEQFTADKCNTLAGKPKLFFVNACRGKKKDVGFRLRFRGRTEADSSQKLQSYKIPNHADFLIAYSTAHDYLSYRECSNGTWFIQCFCEVLNEHYKTKDLLKILTITSRKVALNCRTQSEKEEECELTQVPSITSMLLRDVYFKS